MPAGHNLTSRVCTPQVGYTLGIRLPGSSWQLRLTGHPGHQLWTSLQVRNLMFSPRATGPTFPHMPIPQWAPQLGKDGRGKISRLCRTSHHTAEVTLEAHPIGPRP